MVPDCVLAATAAFILGSLGAKGGTVMLEYLKLALSVAQLAALGLLWRAVSISNEIGSSIDTARHRTVDALEQLRILLL